MEAHRSIVTSGFKKLFHIAEIDELYSLFKSKSDEFYHCTNEVAYQALLKGQLRLTRTDSFLDKNEIKFGLTLFRELINKHFFYKKELLALLSNAESFLLNSTFIFSSIINFPSPEHIKSYGKKILKCHGTKRQGVIYHAVEVFEDGYYYTGTMPRYKTAVGKVIYCSQEQEDIAKKIIQNLEEFVFGKTRPTDSFQMGYVRDEIIVILTIAICLFKTQQYSSENEFRFIFFSKFSDYILQEQPHIGPKKYIEFRFQNTDTFKAI